MAQTIQIVPKYSFPYVETHVNDYTEVNEMEVSAAEQNPIIRYIFPFVSGKGVDNKFIRKRTRKDIVAAYGETNFNKYGQPLMQALHVAEASNSEIWCMRVMPENATYANSVVTAYFKADGNDVEAPKRKFRIKYVQQSFTDKKTVNSILNLSTEDKAKFADLEGFSKVPAIMTFYCAGRGKYGDNFRVRLNQDFYYEKDYGIKYYSFEVLSTESGLKKEATYVGTMVTSSKYNETTLINDILADADDGAVPVYINVDESGVEDLYTAYKAWAESLVTDLKKSYETANKLPESTDDEKQTKTEELSKISKLIDDATNVSDIDMFDIIFGRDVASTNTNSFIEVANGDENDESVVAWDSFGVKLSGGDEGYFDKPGSEITTMYEDGTNKVTTLTTKEEEINLCYQKAFSGEYDKRILTPKRIKAYALWDANYSYDVKNAMVDLAILRNDAICYLDCGIMESFSKYELNNLIEKYSAFNNYNVSKNVHHYYIKEATSKKRVPVTISYFLARQYADHILNYGSHIPFVKSYAQLSGHVKDSLAPSVEDFELDLKETLTDNRFNFFETVDDNVYQRATQNTSQLSLSDLLEESNVATLYEMKRIVEADIVDRLYDFSDSESRQRFRNYEVAKFADWSGREVESFDIDFRMSNWEAERSILHAYIVVVFRGLQKRAILEIDINKRASSDETVE